jgi:hypothetical protein
MARESNVNVVGRTAIEIARLARRGGLLGIESGRGVVPSPLAEVE